MRRVTGPDTAGGPSADRGQPGNDDGELDELRFHWGDACDLAVAGGACTARHRDGQGGTLAHPLPEGLRLLITADYEAHPVPTDLP